MQKVEETKAQKIEMYVSMCEEMQSMMDRETDPEYKAEQQELYDKWSKKADDLLHGRKKPNTALAIFPPVPAKGY